MKKAVTIVAACVFAAGVASAQMKKQQPPPQQQQPSSSPIRITGPNATQATQATTGTLEQARRITTAEALRLQKTGEAVIVDVRSNSQFSLGHIKGSVNIPGSQLISRLRELAPTKLIVTYCA